jgi:hypothetical protein
MKNSSDPTTKKTSKLEQFTLFYETIPAPDYLTEVSTKPQKPLNLGSKRIARRRKN